MIKQIIHNEIVRMAFLGLSLQLIFYLILSAVGIRYGLTPYLIPWVVILILGVVKSYRNDQQ